MADEGSSVWGSGGLEDDVLNTATTAKANEKPTSSSSAAAAAAPRLFDDFGDAGWGAADAETDNKDIADEAERADVINATVSATEEVEQSTEEKQAHQQDSAPAEIAVDTDDFNDDDDAFGNEFTSAAAEGENDDDFGDFGDFDEPGTTNAFDDTLPEEKEQEQERAPSASTSSWQPLRMTSNTTDESLTNDIRELLSSPLNGGRTYPFHDGAVSQLSQERIRQVEGPSQVLAREESRKVWSALSQEPTLKPVDWTRSKTRRQYLIAIGVPINLDELNASSSNGAGGKALPPLALKLNNGQDSTSGERGEGEGGKEKASTMGRAGKERASSLKPPDFDVERAKAIISITEDQLTLQSVPALQTMLREAEGLTRQASAVLTHYLAQREAHTTDAEMYNGLIRDLVTGAAKRVSSSNVAGANNVARRVSVRSNPHHSTSGRNSPAVSGGIGRSSSPRT